MPTLLDEKRPKAQKKRYWIPGLSEDPDTRSIQVGLIWTVLVHLLLFLLAPEILKTEYTPGRLLTPTSNVQQFDIQMMPPPPETAPPTPPPPMHFVETNPNANNNVPDNTTNFGAQNQQAAQLVPDKDSTLHMPKTEGKKDFQNDSQVVTGQLQKPEVVPPTPPAPTKEQPATTAKTETHPKEQVPLPGYIKTSGDNPDAFGTDAVKLPEPSTGAEKYVEGDHNSNETTGVGAKAATVVRPRPLPRPRLAQVRPGILQERPVGVNNAGQIGVDAHFSQFGDYLQELVDIVQIQWERILTQGSTYPKPSSHVTIAFRLNSQGQIAEILKVDGDAGEYGTNAALSAIRDNVPYRPWTKEMVAVLGDDQVITFSFYYW
ncbi:MAG TPA: hypothetical protein VMF63_01245 [Opitutaceae bacterium]|nr:hypothetical protein [Opitutaceae bacterium]